MELLSKPTAKEQSLAQRFRSQGGKYFVKLLLRVCLSFEKLLCNENLQLHLLIQ